MSVSLWRKPFEAVVKWAVSKSTTRVSALQAHGLPSHEEIFHSFGLLQFLVCARKWTEYFSAKRIRGRDFPFTRNILAKHISLAVSSSSQASFCIVILFQLIYVEAYVTIICHRIETLGPEMRNDRVSYSYSIIFETTKSLQILDTSNHRPIHQ